MKDAADSHRYQHPRSSSSLLRPARSAPTACTITTPAPTLDSVLGSLAASLVALASAKCRPGSFAHHELASAVALQQQIAMTAVMSVAIERSGTGLGLDEVYEVVRRVQVDETRASVVAPAPRPVWADALARKPAKVDTFTSLADTQRSTFSKERDAALAAQIDALLIEQRDAQAELDKLLTKLSPRRSEGTVQGPRSPVLLNRPPNDDTAVVSPLDERV